ncbi:hypothetical protein EV421DRAFT_973124 [Armillaria borealis]|uniref:Secreted protein n=1 Tax=Armillaria borealis TaxID=47425 RepID=A0AA39MLF3_9AGAR|nr:hypothetical protein EV421DRAFT_973124 [Armillaria borealis]
MSAWTSLSTTSVSLISAVLCTRSCRAPLCYPFRKGRFSSQCSSTSAVENVPCPRTSTSSAPSSRLRKMQKLQGDGARPTV